MLGAAPTIDFPLPIALPDSNAGCREFAAILNLLQHAGVWIRPRRYLDFWILRYVLRARTGSDCWFRSVNPYRCSTMLPQRRTYNQSRTAACVRITRRVVYKLKPHGPRWVTTTICTRICLAEQGVLAALAICTRISSRIASFCPLQHRTDATVQYRCHCAIPMPLCNTDATVQYRCHCAMSTNLSTIMAMLSAKISGHFLRLLAAIRRIAQTVLGSRRYHSFWFPALSLHSILASQDTNL